MATQIAHSGGTSALSPAARARESIEYFCQILASYDIQLNAETLRQAKFDGASVRLCAAVPAAGLSDEIDLSVLRQTTHRPLT